MLENHWVAVAHLRNPMGAYSPLHIRSWWRKTPTPPLGPLIIWALHYPLFRPYTSTRMFIIKCSRSFMPLQIVVWPKTRPGPEKTDPIGLEWARPGLTSPASAEPGHILGSVPSVSRQTGQLTRAGILHNGTLADSVCRWKIRTFWTACKHLNLQAHCLLLGQEIVWWLTSKFAVLCCF